MMDIEKLVSNGESDTLEFKKSLALKDEIGEGVSALSNTSGGIILVGVTDSREIAGVETGKKTLEDLANYIKTNTDNHIFPKISAVKAEGREIVIIEVKESIEKPVFFKSKAYIRVGKSRHKLSASEIRNLAKESGTKVHWDELICENAVLADIDEEKVRWFLRKARDEGRLSIGEEVPIRDVLMQLKLLKDNKPTNAVIFLFGKNAGLFFLQSGVKCIALQTSEFVKPYTSYQEYGGNLFEQADKATAFVLENIRRSLWVAAGEVRARQAYELPAEAIREAVINAVIHRDYQSTSKVQIRVFPGRVEIWNPGQLPSQLDIDDLRKSHPSIPANPLLFRQFYRAAYVEDAGGGTVDIIQKCRELNLPEPSFEQKMGSFVVTLLRTAITDEYMDALKLNKRQKSAVKYLQDHGRITRAEYEKIHSIPERTANRELNELAGKKVIEKLGSGRETYYVLARTGENWRDKGK
ncbi:MAG: RNA-binding domain-containing protein [archaeon]